MSNENPEPTVLAEFEHAGNSFRVIADHPEDNEPRLEVMLYKNSMAKPVWMTSHQAFAPSDGLF